MAESPADLEISQLEKRLADLREKRDATSDPEIRHGYNEVCDRLDVLISKLRQHGRCYYCKRKLYPTGAVVYRKAGKRSILVHGTCYPEVKRLLDLCKEETE